MAGSNSYAIITSDIKTHWIIELDISLKVQWSSKPIYGHWNTTRRALSDFLKQLNSYIFACYSNAMLRDILDSVICPPPVKNLDDSKWFFFCWIIRRSLRKWLLFYLKIVYECVSIIKRFTPDLNKPTWVTGCGLLQYVATGCHIVICLKHAGDTDSVVSSGTANNVIFVVLTRW